jgi:hypothetical protein
MHPNPSSDDRSSDGLLSDDITPFQLWIVDTFAMPEIAEGCSQDATTLARAFFDDRGASLAARRDVAAQATAMGILNPAREVEMLGLVLFGGYERHG